VWLLNFELRNFWRADLRQGVDGLLADLDLPPDTSLQQLCRERARAIQQLHAQGWIDGWGRQQLVEIALQCLDSLGGLQRIRNTPIPMPSLQPHAMPFFPSSPRLICVALFALALLAPSLTASPVQAHPDHHQANSQHQAPGASEHSHQH